MLWRFDPIAELDRMRTSMDDLMEQFGFSNDGYSFPLLNVYDRKDDIVVTAELPGLSKDDVSVHVSGNILTITGKRNPALGQNVSYVRRERSVGEFEKNVRVPSRVMPDKIAAGFKNGVLTITMPKAEEFKPKVIQVEAK